MSPQGKLLRLRLGEKIRPPWLRRDEEVKVILPEAVFHQSSGEALASFISKDREFSAVAREEEAILSMFNLQEAMQFILDENYCRFRRPLFTRLPFHYHKVPGKMRVWINQMMVAWRNRFYRGLRFPDWPIDKSVETLRWLALKTASQRNGDTAIQRGGMAERLNGRLEVWPFWPEKKKFVFVVTHDVDTKKGFKGIERFRQIDERFGIRSAWFIPAILADEAGGLLMELKEKGHEIGLHGYNHDGKMAFLGEERMRQRLRLSLDVIRGYEMTGFRSPSLFRTPRLFSVLADFFDYDSSVPDTELFTGCASVFPFFKGNLLELPITLPMDATLIGMRKKPKNILKIWRKKMGWIEEVGGLGLMLTHPESHISANPGMLSVYEEFLSEIAERDEAWFALPKEVAAWWREQS